MFSTDFVPYIWVGGGERGVAWLGENPPGHLLDESGIVQRLERSGSTLLLRVELLNKPAIDSTSRRIVLGVQASPTRPMPQDWRTNVATPALPAGGDMMCWGGYQYPDKYPAGHDFRVTDEIPKVRKNRVIDKGVFEDLDGNRPDVWKRAYRNT